MLKSTQPGLKSYILSNHEHLDRPSVQCPCLQGRHNDINRKAVGNIKRHVARTMVTQ